MVVATQVLPRTLDDGCSRGGAHASTQGFSHGTSSQRLHSRRMGSGVYLAPTVGELYAEVVCFAVVTNGLWPWEPKGFMNQSTKARYTGAQNSGSQQQSTSRFISCFARAGARVADAPAAAGGSKVGQQQGQQTSAQRVASYCGLRQVWERSLRERRVVIFAARGAPVTAMELQSQIDKAPIVGRVCEGCGVQLGAQKDMCRWGHARFTMQHGTHAGSGS